MTLTRVPFRRQWTNFSGNAHQLAVGRRNRCSPWGRDERIPRRRKRLIHGGYRSLASRVNRALYPHSAYAKALDPQTRERAARRLFRPPISGAQVRCPDCGRRMQLRLAWKRYSRLFARIAARAWKYRGLIRCELTWMEMPRYVWLADCFDITRNVAGTSTLPSEAASDIT